VKWRSGDKAKWIQAMINCGAYPAATAKQTTLEAQEAAYKRLLRDLNDPECSMGWEIFVLLHINAKVNIFILPFTSTNLFSSADIHERDSGEEDVEQPEQIGAEFTLIPSRIDDSLPCVVILHRSHVTLVTGEDLHEEEEHSGGHYEVLYVLEANCRRTSRIPLDHPAHALLRRIGRDRVAEMVMTNSRQKMEEQYNRNIHVREFKEGEAVGLRTNSIRKGRSKPLRAHNIPALIVGVISRGGNRHLLYRCLTAYGLIKSSQQASDLVDISEGNHQEVYNQLRGLFAELKESKEKIDKAWPRVSVDEARAGSLLLHRTPPSPPPRRQQPPRVDPAAAAVANEVAKAATQHMVRILRERGTQYQIEWSQPESNPERSWESKRKIDTRAEYKDMVLE
jgi:hypothetical protein